jgi:hypothetical protein
VTAVKAREFSASRPALILALSLAFALASSPSLTAQSSAPQSARERNQIALERLRLVDGLYSGGDYEGCGRLLDAYLRQHESRIFRYPASIVARIYGLRALVAYAFRGEELDYVVELRSYLVAALEADPDVVLGEPSEVPLEVQRIFADTRREYLHQFSRSSRRFNVGILGALVIDSTVLSTPSVLQPGVYFSYNLSDAFSVVADLRIPLSAPIWGSIRGAAGISWYPAFEIGKVATSVCAAYQFSLDNLETYTHSVSLAGQAEIIARSGLGLAFRAEFIRLDLILGLTDAADLPSYRSTPLFSESFLRLAFANMNILVFYTF